jgi:hypothetical protein
MLGELKPRFVPGGYRFAREIDGVAASGFGDEPNPCGRCGPVAGGE